MGQTCPGPAAPRTWLVSLETFGNLHIHGAILATLCNFSLVFLTSPRSTPVPAPHIHAPRYPKLTPLPLPPEEDAPRGQGSVGISQPEVPGKALAYSLIHPTSLVVLAQVFRARVRPSNLVPREGVEAVPALGQTPQNQ